VRHPHMDTPRVRRRRTPPVPPEGGLHPLPLYFFRTLGAASLVLAGAGIISGISFTWSASFIYLGLVILVFDPWIEPSLKPYPLWRSLFSLLFLGVVLTFTFGIVLYPAPLQVVSVSYEGLYRTGDSVYGITWDETMSDLRIDVTNPTSRDYDHLDVVVTLGFPVEIRDQRQITDVPGVSFLPVSHEGHMESIGKDGNLTQEQNLTRSQHAYTQVRVLCDRLPKNATMGLILATSKINPAEAKTVRPQDSVLLTHEDSIYEHWVRARPATVSILGGYSVTNRPYKINQTLQVIAQ
jgi:hypothetical protein